MYIHVFMVFVHVLRCVWACYGVCMCTIYRVYVCALKFEVVCVMVCVLIVATL